MRLLEDASAPHAPAPPTSMLGLFSMLFPATDNPFLNLPQYRVILCAPNPYPTAYKVILTSQPFSLAPVKRTSGCCIE
jgi:hypothetical protein